MKNMSGSTFATTVSGHKVSGYHNFFIRFFDWNCSVVPPFIGNAIQFWENDHSPFDFFLTDFDYPPVFFILRDIDKIIIFINVGIEFPSYNFNELLIASGSEMPMMQKCQLTKRGAGLSIRNRFPDFVHFSEYPEE